ncbi:MAG: insulinase family protein [Firmicutes bacterium]|nr:insulinase family protein [Bacillota bacterium]
MTTYHHQRLKNGINVYLHPTKKFKTILVQLIFHRRLDADKVTSSSLLPSVLQRGSVNYPTRQKLAKRLEELYGTELMADVVKKGERQLIVYTLDLVHDQFIPGENKLLQKGLEILNEIVTKPLVENNAFKADYVRQEKEQHEKVIRGLINDKIAYSIERCLQEMCADEPFSVFKYGTSEQLAKIDEKSLYQFYCQFLKESPTDLYLIGDLDVERTMSLVEEIFHYPRGQEVEIPPTLVEKEPEKVRYVKDELEVNQGKLVLGFRTGLSYKDKDYLALLMYNGILGGFPHSKLFQNVREKASLAYYAYSRLEKHKGLMVVSAGIEVTNYDRTLEIIHKQIEDMAKGEFSEEVFQNTYSGLRHQYLLEEDSPAALTNRTLDDILAGRTWTTEELLAELAKVTPEDVVRVAQNIRLDTVYFLTRKGGA